MRIFIKHVDQSVLFPWQWTCEYVDHSVRIGMMSTFASPSRLAAKQEIIHYALGTPVIIKQDFTWTGDDDKEHVTRGPVAAVVTGVDIRSDELVLLHLTVPNGGGWFIYNPDVDGTMIEVDLSMLGKWHKPIRGATGCSATEADLIAAMINDKASDPQRCDLSPYTALTLDARILYNWLQASGYHKIDGLAAQGAL